MKVVAVAVFRNREVKNSWEVRKKGVLVKVKISRITGSESFHLHWKEKW